MLQDRDYFCHVFKTGIHPLATLFKISLSFSTASEESTNRAALQCPNWALSSTCSDWQNHGDRISGGGREVLDQPAWNWLLGAYS